MNRNPVASPNLRAAAFDEGRAAIEAAGLGVSYVLGNPREDAQSRVFNALRRRRRRELLWALRDVDLELFHGEIVGVIGNNGAGKTTLCRVISGQLLPDTGWIRVNGRVTALLAIGAGFKKELSGLENIFLNGMMLGLKKSDLEQRLDGIVSFSGLSAFIDQPLKYYSSGMRSRLAFSIAAAANPGILVMDEALTAGDIEFSEKAGEKLKDLISRSAMAFMVTHNLDFVENYCTRALWMDSGRVADMGTPSDVVSRYKSSHNFQAAKKKQPARLEKTSPSINSRSVAALANVGVRYRLAAGKRRKRDLWALSDIAMTIREGEILGIIGANGAGKTTLCRVLGGILHPDAGSIRVDGTTTALLSFGVGFNKQLTGRDNVYLNGMLMGLGRKTMDAVYEEIAEFSGLGRFMDEPLKNYSKGMRSRLGFSVISRIQPDIFIIDEALNAGDIRFYEKASRKIQELMQEAKATIVVTHNIKFIEKICTRTVWLHEGRIRFDGPPGEAVSRYRRYVREKKKNSAAGGAG